MALTDEQLLVLLKDGISHVNTHNIGALAPLNKVRDELAARGQPSPQPPPSGGTYSETNPPGSEWRPFGSPLYDNVSGAPRDDAYTQKMRAWFTANAPEPQVNYVGVSEVGGQDWNHPIYFSKPSDPLFTIRQTVSPPNASWYTSTGYVPDHVIGASEQIRIPDQAKPADPPPSSGGDAHMCIVDQQGGWVYSLYGVSQKPAGGGTLTCLEAGKAKLGGDGLYVNANAGNLSLGACEIKAGELMDGLIPHAIFCVTPGLAPSTNSPNPTNKVYPASPAIGGGGNRSGAPMLGTRIVQPRTDAEINAITPKWKQAIARALSDFGFVVSDATGSSHTYFTLQFESGRGQTSFGRPDPFKVAFGISAFDFRDVVDVQKFEVIRPPHPLGYGL